MRRGFTLVELLVVISIVALLSTLMLGALYTAQDAAKAQKTRSTVAKLHTAMMARYEAYPTRRVPIHLILEPYTDTNGNGRHDGSEPFTDLNGNGTWDYTPVSAARARLNALRELMRMELPERYSDITDAPISGIPVPSLTQSYRRRLSAGRTDKYQGAECLYLILTTPTDGEESPLENFGASESDDIDGDGMREFVDAWKHPIRFLRWAPALRSDIQNGTDPDPFDSRKVYTGTFALFPLIYSPGPDGVYDIVSDNAAPVAYSAINNNPFHSTVVTDIGKQDDTPQDGEPANGELNWADNITNHLIGTR